MAKVWFAILLLFPGLMYAQSPIPHIDTSYLTIGKAINGNWAVAQSDSFVIVYHNEQGKWVTADTILDSIYYAQYDNHRKSHSIVIADTVMVVSDMGEEIYSHNSEYAGNLYFFGLQNGKWHFRQHFRDSSSFKPPPPYSYWGNDMALSGHQLAVGFANDSILGPSSGSVQMFAYNGSKWYREAVIRPPVRNNYANYGSVVEMFEDRLVFEYTAYTPIEQKLKIGLYKRGRWFIEDTIDTQPALAEWTDGGMSFFGNYIVWSDFYETGSVSHQGMVYLEQRDNATGKWHQSQSLTVPAPQPNDHFGEGMKLYDDKLFAGAPGRFKRGSVYIAERDSGQFKIRYEIPGPNTGAYISEFGKRVQADGNHLLVLSPERDMASNTTDLTYLISLCAFPSIRGKEKDVFCEGDSIHYEAGCSQDSVVWHTVQGVIGTGNRIGLQAVVDDSVWIALYYDGTLRGYDTVRYHVIPRPIAIFTSDTGCAGKTLQFLNVVQPPNQWRYYWDFDHDGFQDDTTHGQANYTFDSVGTYLVRLNIVTEGCIVSYVDTAVVEKCVGMEETKGPPVRIYPNPATRQITVELPSADFERMVITNSLGEQVRQIDLRGLRFRTLVVDWPAGIYFFSFCSQEQVLTRQVVVGF